MKKILTAEKVCRILFVRHAESENNVLREDKEVYEKMRNFDPGITERGTTQTVLLTKYMKVKNNIPKKIYTSCLKRGLQTAEIIQKQFNCDVQVINGSPYTFDNEGFIRGGHDPLQRLGQKGEWNLFKDNYPSFKLDPEIMEDGWNFLQTRETHQQSLERAEKVLQLIKNIALAESKAEEEQKDEKSDQQQQNDQTPKKSKDIVNLVFVMHGNFLNSILGLLLDRKENSDLYYAQVNASITSFEMTNEGEMILIYMNDFTHLSDWFIQLVADQDQELLPLKKAISDTPFYAEYSDKGKL